MVSELAHAVPIDETTVADAAAGDAVALARIVAPHHNDMARACFVICGNQDTAQDAAQAAWAPAWRALGSLRDPERLRPWLVSVAADEARQLMCRGRRHAVVEIARAATSDSHSRAISAALRCREANRPRASSSAGAALSPSRPKLLWRVSSGR